jgi:acetylornithine deacetylase/succinyl-diaminopimelate desuccinylase-like protein
LNFQDLSINWSELQQEALVLLQTYLRFDTTNPPGNEEPAARFVHERLCAEGIESRLLETQPRRINVIARLRGNGAKRPLILMSHSDVVYANPAEWSAPPFSGEVRDGYVYGRGALDMKGLGIVNLMTMLMLKRAHVQLSRDIILLTVAGEERDPQVGAKYLMENFRDELGHAEFMLNEGGSVVQARFPEPFARFAPSRVWLVTCGEKGGIRVRVKAKGLSTHPGVGSLNNPHVRLVRVLDKILSFKPPIVHTSTMDEAFQRIVYRYVPRLFAPLFANKFVMALVAPFLIKDPMIGPTLRDNIVLLGFEEPTTGWGVIPSESSAIIACQKLPGRESQILSQLRALVGNDSQVSFEIISESQDLASPYTSELFRVIERVAHREDAQSLTLPVFSLAATDSRFFRPYGVQCYGLLPFDLTPSELVRIHGNDERLSIENLQKGLRRWGEIVWELCGV